SAREATFSGARPFGSAAPNRSFDDLALGGIFNGLCILFHVLRAPVAQRIIALTMPWMGLKSDGRAAHPCPIGTRTTTNNPASTELIISLRGREHSLAFIQRLRKGSAGVGENHDQAACGRGNRDAMSRLRVGNPGDDGEHFHR